MATTPKALLKEVAYQLASWQTGQTPASQLANAQTVINTVAAGPDASAVFEHPMTKWVADEFRVSWLRASAAVSPQLGP